MTEFGDRAFKKVVVVKFPGGSVVKNQPANAGDQSPGQRLIPWGRKWQPTPVFSLGKSQGPGSLEGYSPWSRKESDTTERLSGKESACNARDTRDLGLILELGKSPGGGNGNQF